MTPELPRRRFDLEKIVSKWAKVDGISTPYVFEDERPTTEMPPGTRGIFTPKINLAFAKVNKIPVKSAIIIYDPRFLDAVLHHEYRHHWQQETGQNFEFSNVSII